MIVKTNICGNTKNVSQQAHLLKVNSKNQSFLELIQSQRQRHQNDVTGVLVTEFEYIL